MKSRIPGTSDDIRYHHKAIYFLIYYNNYLDISLVK